MKKILLTIILLILTTSPVFGQELKPVFPWDEDIYGFRYRENIQGVSPYFALAYDFTNRKTHYQLGANLQVTQNTELEFDYRHWPNKRMPGYLYQNGYKTAFIRKDHFSSLDKNLSLTTFRGEVGNNLNEELEIEYIALDYWEELYNGYNSKAIIHLEGLYGESEANEFHIARMELPIKNNDFYFNTYLGYIKQGSVIKPAFNLNNYVKGYHDHGNTLLAINLEQRFDFLKQANFSLRGAFFSQIGAVVNYNEGINKDDVRANVGAALIAPLDDRFELRLNTYLNREREWESYDLTIKLKPFKF